MKLSDNKCRCCNLGVQKLAYCNYHVCDCILTKQTEQDVLKHFFKKHFVQIFPGTHTLHVYEIITGRRQYVSFYTLLKQDMWFYSQSCALCILFCILVEFFQSAEWPKKYIVAQYPHIEERDSFWTMVAHEQIKILVDLDEDVCWGFRSFSSSCFCLYDRSAILLVT